MTKGEPLIKVENLTVAYGDKEVLRDITLSVARDEVLGIVGETALLAVPYDHTKVFVETTLNDPVCNALAAELEDRFGALPAEAETLLAIARVRSAARACGVARIDAGPAAIAFTPRKDFAGDADAAVALGAARPDPRRC